MGFEFLFEYQAPIPHLLDHPPQGDVREALHRVASADIRMDAGKPDLLDRLMRMDWRLTPKDRMKRLSFIVNGKGLTGKGDVAPQIPVVKFFHPKRGALNCFRDVVRRADGSNRIPNAGR